MVPPRPSSRPAHSWTREIVELTRIRFLLFLREPEAIFWIFVFPIILAVALGLAFRDRGVESGIVAIIDGGGDRFEASLEEAPHLSVEKAQTVAEGEDWLRAGKVAVLLLPGGDGSGVRLRYDPTRPESETTRLRVEDAVQRGAGRVDPVPILREEVRETGARYIDWLVPGLLGMNLMGTGIWGVGFGIVDTRRKKLLERFLVTPMRRSSFLLSFVLNRLIFLLLEVAVILGFAVVALGVPFRGSILLLVVVCLAGALSFSGLGLLAASRARTLEGVSGLMNLVMMPMWVCSGVFFSYHNFPEALHGWIEALPLTAINNGLRAVILQGDGFVSVIPALAVAAAWGAGSFAIALKIFRWR